MTSIRVAVTAACIASNPPKTPQVKEPLAHAIADAVGLPMAEVMLDGDVEHQAIVTIGQGQTTVVLNLPAEAGEHYWRYWNREPVEPFEFDLELEDWLIAMVAKATPGMAAFPFERDDR